MAHFAKKALQLAPNQLLFQQKRYRGKINLKKPKIFYKRAVVNDLLTPFFTDPNKNKTIEELCFTAMSDPKIENKLGPYDQIIAKDVRNWLEQSRMVACIHANSMRQEELLDTVIALRKENIYYKWYGAHIVHEAIKDSPFQDLGPLISQFTSFIFSPDINVAILEKILKKSMRMYILGGALEGHVLRHDDFLKYGKISIESAQMGLVQTLQNAGGANLNRQLTHHQSTLVTRLKQIGTNETTTNENEQSVPV